MTKRKQASPALSVTRNLFENPEIVEIASQFEIRRSDSAGCCLMVWLWVERHGMEGAARDSAIHLLDEMVGIKGFVDFLILVGWVRVLKREPRSLYFTVDGCFSCKTFLEACHA